MSTSGSVQYIGGIPISTLGDIIIHVGELIDESF